MFKRILVGSKLGSVLLIARSYYDLKNISYSNPEQATMVANGILANKLISNLCKPNGVFLDIGAHIGTIFSEAYGRSRTLKVIAVEADERKATWLRHKFPYCEVIHCAVSDTEGTATFYTHTNQSGYSSLMHSDNAGVYAEAVEVKRLDQLLPDVTVDVIKIDVEGAELGALRGGEALISRSRPTIMFESVGTGQNSLGYSARELWRWLDAGGFQVFTPDRVAHDVPPMGLEAFCDAHEYPMRTHNYFAVPSERRIEIRDKARRIVRIRV
jgi:FkbM family methyltransferase